MNGAISQLINDRGNGAVNQFIIHEDDKIVFQSYRTRIACKQGGKVYAVYGAADWSKTTSKHLYIFLRKYCGLDVNSKREYQQAVKDGIIVETKEV